MRINRLIPMVFVGMLATVLMAACNLPIFPAPPDPGRSATETFAALATQVQATLVAVPSPMSTETPTPAPAGPTEVVSTPTPVASPTDVTPRAHLNENTNCRTGPAAFYDHKYTALKGMDLVIVGRTTVSDYVIVAIPDQPGQLCWLWTRYAEISGDLTSLPLSTPPPTPTPSLKFSLSYSYMEGCVGWDPGFQVVNTGSVTFESGKIKAEDTVENFTVEDSTDVFDKRNGCAIDTSIPDLDPGDTGYIYANTFIEDPDGHELEVTVTLCTGPGQTGQCVSKSLNVTP
jgi:hypothetical protein